jgi:hypothetical protein
VLDFHLWRFSSCVICISNIMRTKSANHDGLAVEFGTGSTLNSVFHV